VKTFMARFTRPNGDQGVIYVLAASAGLAVLDVLKRQAPVDQVNVTPTRRAALLMPSPWLAGSKRRDPSR
jgi:hypothetical protein